MAAGRTHVRDADSPKVHIENEPRRSPAGLIRAFSRV